MRLLPYLAFLTLLSASGAPKWNVAYLYDEDKSTLSLRGVEFPSDQRGIAIGTITENGRAQHVALITADGGVKWDTVRLKDAPLSLACFTDAVCWISTPGGVYRTEEGGRTWTRISKTKGILKMQFVSPEKGWAAGARKSAWQTVDGGKNWTPLPVLNEVKANPNHSGFQAVAMQGEVGFIGGNSRPPRKDDSPFPDWMVPEDAARRREWPGLMVILETRDAGKTWAVTSNSIFGLLTAIRIRPEGKGALALLEYFHSFEFPAEVLTIDFKNGRTSSIFRDKTTAITDIVAGPAGETMLAGTAVVGLRGLPIPQKVLFRESTQAPGSDTSVWEKHEVDYRATATRVHLARSPGGRYWAVTDTGIILRLDRAPKPAN